MNIELDLFKRRFERHVVFSKPFVNLGREYYDNGQVINLTQDSPNEWHAKVKGIKDYSVNVYLKEFEYSSDTEIYKSICDCSFNGPHCIHKVAAYYAIYNYIFPNEHSKGSVTERTLSELENDIIVQEAYWELRKVYLELNDSLDDKDVSETFRRIRKSLTIAKNIAKSNNPILAVRLSIVSYYELMAIKAFLTDCKDWDKFEERWDKLYERTKRATSDVISSIRDENVSRHVTVLLLNETLELQHSLEQLSEQLTEQLQEGYFEFFKEHKELYFKILIELSPSAQSYEQIKQLLNEPRLLMPREKERFTIELLAKQGNE